MVRVTVPPVGRRPLFPFPPPCPPLACPFIGRLALAPCWRPPGAPGMFVWLDLPPLVCLFVGFGWRGPLFPFVCAPDCLPPLFRPLPPFPCFWEPLFGPRCGRWPELAPERVENSG